MSGDGGQTEDKNADVAVETPAPEALMAEVEKLRADLAENRERMLRAVAESDNVRRRAEQDAAQAKKFALERFAAELLPVRDSLERAGAIDRDAQGIDAFVAGVDLTLKLMDSVLEKFSVTVVDPVGQRFNPEQQQAMTMIESDTVPANHVVEVVQKGFLLHDRLLRPALVVVAKGRP